MFSFTLPLTFRWGGWLTTRLGRFTTGKDSVTLVQEAGWFAGPVWTGTEKLARTGIRFPDRPARSESL